MGYPILLSSHILPRGSGPLVSVLLPTRGRPQDLCASIDSLHSLAKDKTLIEYVIKVDDDDTETVELVERLANILPVKTMNTPRGNGYLDMHFWVNHMSKMATGDWLFLFNDDAKMLTPDWDQMLLTLSGDHFELPVADAILLLTDTEGLPDINAFMFVRRKAIEAMGRYSACPFCDAWLYRVMSFARLTCKLPQPIVIRHEPKRDGSQADRGIVQYMISTEAIMQQMVDVKKLLEFTDNGLSYRG